MQNEEKAVVDLLGRYQAALNASDVDAIMRLYAPDCVFMPQHSPSSIGTAAVRAAYVAVFESIKLDVVFSIAEVRQLAPEWAIARTNSTGTTRIHATGRGGPEANQELFVLQKVDGAWKIARYCFCTTNPPRAGA